jgi:hypothetical protein
MTGQLCLPVNETLYSIILATAALLWSGMQELRHKEKYGTHRFKQPWPVDHERRIREIEQRLSK